MAEIGSSQRAQLPGALLAVTAEQHPQQAAAEQAQGPPAFASGHRLSHASQAQAAQGVRGLLVIRLLVACQRF